MHWGDLTAGGAHGSQQHQVFGSITDSEARRKILFVSAKYEHSTGAHGSSGDQELWWVPGEMMKKDWNIALFSVKLRWSIIAALFIEALFFLMMRSNARTSIEEKPSNNWIQGVRSSLYYSEDYFYAHSSFNWKICKYLSFIKYEALQLFRLALWLMK